MLAALAMFSGAALLLYILAGISLRISLTAGLIVVLTGLSLTLRRSAPAERRLITRGLGAGATAGVLATMAYDLSKAGLSVVDPSPFNPFHVIHVFGELLVGRGASETAVVATGAGFHLLNGTMFGVAYTFMFARDGAISLRRGVTTGIGWGIFLELFQLTLYPGWLDIRTYGEFATISALGHVVYGATLGTVVRSLLRSTRPVRADALT
jgi:hypothetical protein